MLQDNKISYTTDVCVSIIAIAGSLDYRYLEENDIDIDVFDQGEEFVCELRSGMTVPIRGTDDQMQMLQSLLSTGQLISSEMTIGIADNMISLHGDDSVYLPPGDIILEPRKISTARRQQRMLRSSKSNEGDNKSRNLVEGPKLPLEGTKPILAVRIIDSGGLVHQDSADAISDNIFGTDDDKLNAKSQFEACSFGKLRITNEYTVDISEHLAAPGVIEVDIPISLENNDRKTLRTAMIEATEEKLGFDLPGPFQHVMFVIERCYTDCGWAAYAYVNSWLSIYQADNYKHVAVQLHELGHNLNMVSLNCSETFVSA